MEVTTIGIDLAKSAFAVSGADGSGRVVMRRQLRPARILSFMRRLPRCTVGMEASGGAQLWLLRSDENEDHLLPAADEER
jgi:transposase